MRSQECNLFRFFIQSDDLYSGIVAMVERGALRQGFECRRTDQAEGVKRDSNQSRCRKLIILIADLLNASDCIINLDFRYFVGHLSSRFNRRPQTMFPVDINAIILCFIHTTDYR